VFTADDPTNYVSPLTNTVSLVVNKATPTITAAPMASAITYGQALSASTLSGGSANVPGTFAWENTSMVPLETASYPVTFTPTDAANYSTGATNVIVTVNPATNDAFASAMVCNGTSWAVTGINIGATGEPGEPNHARLSGTLHSIWYRWTAPYSGTVTLETANSMRPYGYTFDPTLAVYTGSSLSNLIEIGSDDDAGPGLEALVHFSAHAGTTYQIALAGYDGDMGTSQLRLSMDTSYLAGLTVSRGELTPGFSATWTNYALDVAWEVSSLTITPVAADPASVIQVRINGGI